MRSHWLPGSALLALILPLTVYGQTRVFVLNPFDSSAELALQGDAGVSGGVLRLTPAEPDRVGGAWYQHKRYLQAGFETTFTFRCSDRGNGGGEGLAFVVQNAGLPSLGPAGGALGYAGVYNSLAVEFDTRANGTNDAPAPHVSVQTRGTPASAQTNSAEHSASLGAVTNGLPDLADGNPHAARIRYGDGALAVFLDGAVEPVLSVTVDLGTRLAFDRGQAWFGLTAANGTGFQQHEILDWSFTTAATPVTVTITSPIGGTSYLAPGTAPLTAEASSTDGTITRVEYWQGSRRLGEATNSPFRFSWESIFPGPWLITATAFDDRGQTNVSAPVEVLVLPAWSVAT